MTFSADQYLRKVLPALIRSREAPGPLPCATIQFSVIDEPGLRVIYRLDPENGLEVTDGVSDQQDLGLAFLKEDLQRFSNNTLDAMAALQSRRLKVYGDESLLKWLASHLSH